MNSMNQLPDKGIDSEEIEERLPESKVGQIIGNYYERFQEEIALNHLKIFEKSFFVNIIARHAFLDDGAVVDYLMMHEINIDQGDTEEVEDKNWFDDDNVIPRSAVGSFSEFPDVGMSKKY